MAETRNPLDGPFMSSRQLTDYSDEPGYAIPASPLQPVYEAKLAAVREALEAAGVPAPLARRKAAGVYSDWLDAVLGQHTAESLTAYAARKAGH